MSYLQDIVNEIEATHKGLGNLAAVAALIAKCHKAMLIVSPSGCGKSTVMDWVAVHYPDSLTPDRVSVAGLASLASKMDSFNSVVCVDDIATTQTDYARITTITALTSLCYTHRIQSVMGGENNAYDISNFYGSALIGIQPILLKWVMASPEWDASIQDKCLRYYHLIRPESPNSNVPTIEANHGLAIEQVKDYTPDANNADWRMLQSLGMIQWGRARTRQHLIDLLKGSAAIDNRREVAPDDLKLLAILLKPMAFEQIVVNKTDFEGERSLNNTLLALLTEYYSYAGQFALGNLVVDYKISLQQAYKIMGNQNGNWKQISKSPTIYTADDKLIEQLKKYGLDWRE